MLQQHFQGLAVALEHREHEKGQHYDDHECRRHADADHFLCQEEQWYAHQRTETEADDLSLGQIE